jgi:tetratricopeptide (TPR) repeat protein
VGYRYRKSINLGGGVRLNLSKSGVGYSVGGKGYRYTRLASGPRRTTYSLPGTGISYVKQSGGSRRREPQRYAPASVAVERPAAATPTKPPAPALFASRYEREFSTGVKLLHSGQVQEALAAFEAAALADEKNKAQADDLLVGLLHAHLGQVEQAILPLEKVVASEVALPDKLITKYLSDFTMSVTYAADLTAKLSLDSVAAGVVLAECYRKHGRTEEAIGLLQQLATHRPDPHFFLALAELYSETEAWDDLDELLEEPAVKTGPWNVLVTLRNMKADHLRAEGRDEEAWALAERTWLSWYQAEQNLPILTGLCQLGLVHQRYDDVIRFVTSYGITNSDDEGFKLKLLEAQAMDEKGLDEAALAIYKELLQSKPRDPSKVATTIAQIERQQRQRAPELLKEARYLRGRLYLKMGKHGMGNRDLSFVYAQDPTYRDVAQLLEA